MENLYPLVKDVHSFMRWLIIGFAAIAIVLFVSGWIRKKKFTSTDDRASLIYMIVCDLQLLIGLLLYFFFSPVTQSFLQLGDGALESSGVRFYSMEHPTMMILGIIAVHVGRMSSKKAGADATKFKRGSIWFVLSLILFLAGLPWQTF